MQQKLFTSQPENILPHDGEALFYPEFFTSTEAMSFFQSLQEDIEWRQEPIKIFGKEVMQPRLTALYGDPTIPYGYSGIEMQSLPFTAGLTEILERVQVEAETDFTHVLMNYYRDGQDSMGWHRDNEAVLGRNPTIASVSFGQSREFQFRLYADKTEKISCDLTSGSLLLMRGTTQHYWEHQIPKRKRIMGGRINLTFRKIMAG